MPPRYAYWTILIDGQATAFRARDREELLPTFNQLARKNADIVMRYFARGRLWDNPEQAQWANRNREVRPTQSRDRDWRPGGQHKDPRARFEKTFDRRPFQSKEGKPFGERRPFSPRDRKPRFEPRPNLPEHRDDRDQQRERPKWHGKAYGKPRDEARGKPPDQRFQAKDRRESKAGAHPRKRTGNWNRPPKRKPR